MRSGSNKNVEETFSFQLVKEGNREEYNRLFRFYYPKMMAYSCLILDEEIARDVVQDVFLYVWENRARIDFGGGFRSYLFQMTYSRSVDFLRKNKLKERLQEGEEAVLHEELDWLSHRNEDIIETLFSQDLRQKIENLVAQLPEQRQEVFRLTYFSDMAAKEIADLLDMPQRTVESHIYLSIKYLRERLSLKELYLFFIFIYFF